MYNDIKLKNFNNVNVNIFINASEEIILYILRISRNIFCARILKFKKKLTATHQQPKLIYY